MVTVSRIPEATGAGGSVVAGVDGCRGRWLCVWGDPARPSGMRAALLDTPHALERLRPLPAVVGVDIPIGLPGDAPREADRAARRLLGRPRGSSVFPAPLRCMLQAPDYATACQLGRDRCGRALSRQSWNILPLIRAMDAYLLECPARPGWVQEVHPELGFMVWNDGVPMARGKKTPQGRAARLGLVEAALPGALSAARASLGAMHCPGDDLLDALAAFGIAARIAMGRALRLPDPPERDALGLPMCITC
ncbi:DUF429 domain-containing protein [Ectothiorhodospira mobilis]|uniref:DUF429 domain-containing protein n=1 Tax=Ectothiorhodospira mobilis TaxID=195064 RepID=UPI0019057E1E|nr:DUF429 domain-containing protein [Ectothiorhodospira mobilis]MBK1690742.1 hypothetical protein [Ectothiorhodospira mobilis]